jgi:hypothetical protein
MSHWREFEDGILALFELFERTGLDRSPRRPTVDSASDQARFADLFDGPGDAYVSLAAEDGTELCCTGLEAYRSKEVFRASTSGAAFRVCGIFRASTWDRAKAAHMALHGLKDDS